VHARLCRVRQYLHSRRSCGVGATAPAATGISISIRPSIAKCLLVVVVVLLLLLLLLLLLMP